MNDHHNAEEDANRVLLALKTVVAGLEARLSHVTVKDLREMEARLVHEIRSDAKDFDASGLEALLVRSKANLVRLKALNAQTQ